MFDFSTPFVTVLMVASCNEGTMLNRTSMPHAANSSSGVVLMGMKKNHPEPALEAGRPSINKGDCHWLGGQAVASYDGWVSSFVIVTR